MQKENKMGVMPIKKLVISMSLPMMISMLVQALYNVVDSVVVSQVCDIMFCGLHKEAYWCGGRTFLHAGCGVVFVIFTENRLYVV